MTIRAALLRRLPLGLAALLALLVWTGNASAQQSVNVLRNMFELEQPGHLDLTLFGGGYGSDQYGVIQEGFQLDQSITRGIGVFGRATGYQLFLGQGFDSPLDPGSGHRARFNFGRLQAGFDLAPFQNTHLFISGGHDVGDSDAYVVEGDFSTWLLVHSLHPVSFSFSAVHDYQNGVTSSSIDLQAVVKSTENFLFLGGAGGAIYGGGFVGGATGQAGPDLGLYYRPWRMGVSVQAGYGVAHQYGQLSFFKQLGFTE